MPTADLHVCLWFENQADAAVEHYLAVFGDGRRVHELRQGGALITATIELRGMKVVALNGANGRAFTEAISLVVPCDTQAEIDRLWAGLTDGGAESRCGWLRDRFGVSWQIVPRDLGSLLGGPDPAGSQRAVQAMLKMNKLDIAALKAAYAG